MGAETAVYAGAALLAAMSSRSKPTSGPAAAVQTRLTKEAAAATARDKSLASKKLRGRRRQQLQFGRAGTFGASSVTDTGQSTLLSGL